MKKRNVASVVVLGAVALGIYLGQFYKGLGLGGSGTGWGLNESSAPSTRPQAGVLSGTSSFAPTAKLTEEIESTSPDFGLPAQTINIVIFDNQFRIATAADPKSGRILDLDQVKKEAAETVGSQEGIRVLILKEKSAQEGARADLLKALADAGVKRDEILERSEFVK